MSVSSPASTIMEFLRRLPVGTAENIAAVAYMTVSRGFMPSPDDCYVDLLEEYLFPERAFDAKSAAILAAGVIDHHLAVVRPLSSDEFLHLAKKMPTDFFQMGVLTADDRKAEMESARDEWEELRESSLHPLVLAGRM